MAPQIIHLPDGHSYHVTPVFAGVFFKSHESSHNNAFPIGWSVVLHTEEEVGEEEERKQDQPKHGSEQREEGASEGSKGSSSKHDRPHKTRSFTKPTLQHDKLFISSISSPSTDSKPAASPTRQIAMMLWVTLYWYFHQAEPPATLETAASKATPDSGKPRGEWRVGIKRDGVLRGRNLIPKLERMGLIATLESAVGTNVEDNEEGWNNMFVSRKMFWQIPGRLFLFTQPTDRRPPHSYPGSPTPSRPASPVPQQLIEVSAPGGALSSTPSPVQLADVPPLIVTSKAPTPSAPIGPFYSSSHLPTYYPPAPPVYTMTDFIRHPIRPKPPRMGEIFYSRFVPSVGQYLSFRVASLSNEPVPYSGPVGPHPPEQGHLATMSDTDLLKSWLGNSRVSAFWGGYESNFLPDALSKRHSFPAIGMWDGVPFGYFEIYWVKEDVLGKYSGAGEDFDRGFHVLIGEDWARGRVQPWISSMVHYSFSADYRTNSVCIEPRVDNKRFIQHLQFAGFSKEKEIAFPHKQSWFGRLQRENWDGPAL